MGEILIPARASTVDKSALLTPSQVESTSIPPVLHLQSSEEVIRALQSKPDPATLTACLRWLLVASPEEKHFNIHIPSARASEAINTLINEILPNFWHSIRDSSTKADSTVRRLILKCLRNLAGLNGLATRLQRLVECGKEPISSSSAASIASEILPSISEMIEVMEVVLEQDSLASSFWSSVKEAVHSARRDLIWKEFVSLLGGGRLISVVALACAFRNERSSKLEIGSWIGDGRLFTSWLGRNIHVLLLSERSSGSLDHITRLFSRSLGLGYSGNTFQI